MTTSGQCALAERLSGIDEIECVTPDLNGVPRGKVMTAAGFLEGRRLQMARGCCCSASWVAIRRRASTGATMATWPW